MDPVKLFAETTLNNRVPQNLILREIMTGGSNTESVSNRKQQVQGLESKKSTFNTLLDSAQLKLYGAVNIIECSDADHDF